MKKIIFLSIIIILAILVSVIYKYNRMIQDKEKTFIIESSKALGQILGLDKKNIQAENRDIKIFTDCNFDIQKAKKHLLAFFEKQKYKVSIDIDDKNKIYIDNKKFSLQFIPEEPNAYVAFVLDDVGYSIKMLYPYFDLNIPITFAVLPRLEYTKNCIQSILDEGYTYIMHQPMEAMTSDAMARNIVLLTTDTDDKVREKIEKNLATMDTNVVGVNNHTGSKFTADPIKMKVFLEELKAKNLFFLDSKTTSHSVAKQIARELGVKYLENNVFLDVEKNEDYIISRFNKALNLALEKNGEKTNIIIIGHVQTHNLIPAFKKIITKYNQNKIKFITLSEMIKNENSSN